MVSGLLVKTKSLLRKKEPLIMGEPEKAEVVKPADYADCLIIIEKSSKLIRRRLAAADLPGNSIKRDYGFLGHLLGFDLDGKLWAIEPPSNTRKNKHPAQYFSYHGIIIPLVQRAITLPSDIMEKLKFGLFVALIIVELVMLGFIIIPLTGG